jgi:hypothetical protein
MQFGAVGLSVNQQVHIQVCAQPRRELHFVKFMGPQVVLLGMDMRSQRKKNRIMPPVSRL